MVQKTLQSYPNEKKTSFKMSEKSLNPNWITIKLVGYERDLVCGSQWNQFVSSSALKKPLRLPWSKTRSENEFNRMVDFGPILSNHTYHFKVKCIISYSEFWPFLLNTKSSSCDWWNFIFINFIISTYNSISEVSCFTFSDSSAKQVLFVWLYWSFVHFYVAPRNLQIHSSEIHSSLILM